MRYEASSQIRQLLIETQPNTVNLQDYEIIISMYRLTQKDENAQSVLVIILMFATSKEREREKLSKEEQHSPPGDNCIDGQCGVLKSALHTWHTAQSFQYTFGKHPSLENKLNSNFNQLINSLSEPKCTEQHFTLDSFPILSVWGSQLLLVPKPNKKVQFKPH